MNCSYCSWSLSSCCGIPLTQGPGRPTLCSPCHCARSMHSSHRCCDHRKLVSRCIQADAVPMIFRACVFSLLILHLSDNRKALLPCPLRANLHLYLCQHSVFHPTIIVSSVTHTDSLPPSDATPNPLAACQLWGVKPLCFLIFPRRIPHKLYRGHPVCSDAHFVSLFPHILPSSWGTANSVEQEVEVSIMLLFTAHIRVPLSST